MHCVPLPAVNEVGRVGVGLFSPKRRLHVLQELRTKERGNIATDKAVSSKDGCSRPCRRRADEARYRGHDLRIGVRYAGPERALFSTGVQNGSNQNYL